MTAADDLNLIVSAYRLRIGVSASDRRLLDLMTARLPPKWSASRAAAVDRAYALVEADGGSGAAEIDLLVDGARRSRGRDLDPLLDELAADIQSYVAEMAPGQVFVHAGVVGWKGRAIIVPGRSGSGKTTLVAELVRAGASYYSDEYAVLDDRGYVHAYPQLLSMRRADTRPLRVAAEALGGTAGESPLPVGLVVLTRYRPEAVWHPEALSAGRGVLALVRHTVSMRRQPAEALASLRHAVAHATVLRGERGDAGALARSLLHDEMRAGG